MKMLGRVGCAVLLMTVGAGLLLGWQNRARMERWLAEWRGTALPTVGRPSAEALARAHDRVDSLNGWRADSVLLLADEAAALVAEGFQRAGLALDSLEVELDSGRVVLRGILPVEDLPEDVGRPLRGLVGDEVALTLGGPLAFEREGRARWQVDRGQVGSLTLPLAVARRLVEALAPGAGNQGLPVHIPEGVTDIRLIPGALILHGKGPDS